MSLEGGEAAGGLGTLWRERSWLSPPGSTRGWAGVTWWPNCAVALAQPWAAPSPSHPPPFAPAPLCFNCPPSYITFGRKVCYCLPKWLFFRSGLFGCHEDEVEHPIPPVRKLSFGRAVLSFGRAVLPLPQPRCERCGFKAPRPRSTAHPRVCPLCAEPVPSGDIYPAPWDTLLCREKRGRGGGRGGRGEHKPRCVPGG